MLNHQVVHLVDRSGCGIFDGQNAILAHSLLNGGENTVKILEIENHGTLKNFLAGQLGVSAFHSLTGYHGGTGKELRGVFNGGGNLPEQRCFRPVALGLIASAQFKNGGVETPRIARQLRPGLLPHGLQNLPLPGRNKNRQISLSFVVRHLGGNFHSGAE